MGPFKHQKNTLLGPCLAVNQRIDKQNAMVLNHTAIYEHSLSQITESNTVQNALIILNPLMAAPSLASGESDIIDPQAGSEAMGLLILQEIAPTEKTVLFEATMTSGYYKNAETNGEGYRYDITSFRVYKMDLYA